MDVATAKRPLWKAASTETSCRRLLMNAEYRDELNKIARTLQDLSERTGTGSDLILCDLFNVLEIDASIKIRYGRTTRSLRTVTKVPVKGARK
jgi:hypothetical protein